MAWQGTMLMMSCLIGWTANALEKWWNRPKNSEGGEDMTGNMEILEDDDGETS